MAHGHHCNCINSAVSYLPFEDSSPFDLLKPKPRKLDDSGPSYYVTADKIYTLEDENKVAKAIRIQGETIKEVYTSDQWSALLSGAKGAEVKKHTTTLKGVLYPGFHECHMHPLLSGLLHNSGVDMRQVYDADSLVNKMKGQLEVVRKKIPSAKQQNGVAVIGYNVDPLSQCVPTTQLWVDVLNQVGPPKPADYKGPDKVYCIVEHLSMHIWYVNQNMLDAIFARHPDMRDKSAFFPKKDDKYTGVVQEDEGISALMDTINHLGVMDASAKTLTDAAHAIARQAQSQGCTTIGEAMLGSVQGDLAAYLASAHGDAADFPVRLIMHPLYKAPIADYIADKPEFRNGYLNKRLSFGGVKYVIDGSLQGGTAYDPPYEQAGFDTFFNSDIEGVLNMDQPTLEEQLSKFKGQDFQPMIHVNSTKAIQIAIDALINVLSDEERAKVRPRLEHAQVASKQQLSIMAENGITPNFLVNHIFYYGKMYYEKLLPKTVAEAISPVQSALNRGLKAALHSDAYVSPLSPLRLIWQAVTRMVGWQGKSTGVVLNPEECVSVEDALKAVTLHAAYIDFEEDIKGSIKPGKLADLTLLDRDLFELKDPDEILTAQVLGTVLGGTFVKPTEPTNPN